MDYLMLNFVATHEIKYIYATTRNTGRYQSPLLCPNLGLSASITPWRSASSVAGRPLHYEYDIYINYMCYPPSRLRTGLSRFRAYYLNMFRHEATRPSPHLSAAAPLKEIPPEVRKSRCSEGNEPDNGTVRCGGAILIAK